MTTAAYLIVSFALGVAIGGIILAAGVAVYVLRVGMPGGFPVERDGSRSTGPRHPGWVEIEPIESWRAK